MDSSSPQSRLEVDLTDRHLPRIFWFFLLLACGLEAALLGLALLKNWNDNILIFLPVYFFAFCLYAVGAYFALRKEQPLIPGLSGLILISAVVFRLTVLWCPPSLSEDFYRYRWDGIVQNAGHGPYDHPPESPELAGLRDGYYEKINHKNIWTPYPPAAENLFRMLASISSDLIPFKAGIVLFDLLLLEVLRRLLKKEQLSPSLLLLYAWHPLPIVEFAGSGHIDVVSISLLMTSFLLIDIKRKGASGILFGLAVLTKYLPLAAVPWLVRKGGWKFLLLLGVTGILLVWQFYTPDLRLWKGLFSFYKKWRFKDSFFGVLYDWFGGAEAARNWGAFFTAMTAVLCLVARFSFYRSMFMIIGAVIIFSPVVHPWYLCWMIPFLVFHHSKPWIFFSGWIALSYLIRFLYPTGVWQPVPWLKALIYLPFYFLLFTDLFAVSRSDSGCRGRS